MQAQLQEVADNRVLRRTFNERISEYYDITGKFAVLRNKEAEEAFGKKGIEFDENEEDPLKRALAEYYKAQNDSKTPAGLFNSEKYNDNLRRLGLQWTPRQKEYVAANTNMRPIPPRLLAILPNKAQTRIRVSGQARTRQKQRRLQEKRLRISQ